MILVVAVPFAAIILVLFGVPLTVRAIVRRVRTRRTVRILRETLTASAEEMARAHAGIAQALARGDCPWCWHFGFGSIPSDCTCDAACGDVTCKHVPVTREVPGA
jgi:hypothetical protein